jgi:undecaprenyl-diphosphatase
MSVRSWATRGDGARRVLQRWLAARELATLALLALLAGGLWTFLEIADAVREDESRALDERVLLAMREPGDRGDPLGPQWFEEMGRDVTALGGTTLVAGATLATAGFLALAGRRRALALLLVTVGGGQVLSVALKQGFARPRPELVPHASYVYTSSFPSGHAMMSAVTYLTIAALVARLVPGRRMKAFVVACAVTITLLTGVSRVYLGVHWPTDVIAGWAIGASWATGCWLVADWLERRRRETPAAVDPSKAT